MCMGGGSSKQEAPPPPPAAPMVLEQAAPAKAIKPTKTIKKKNKPQAGTSTASTTNASLGGIKRKKVVTTYR